MLIQQAKLLRKEGYSLSEIAQSLHIAKSTASVWCRNMILSQQSKALIVHKMDLGRQKSIEIKKLKKDVLIKSIEGIAAEKLSKICFDCNTYSLMAALLYWGEGAKLNTHHVTFINSDPLMIRTFLYVFRNAFSIKEEKFRIVLHLHEYHDEEKMKAYWSEITNIPPLQFSKTYIKPHTGKTKREDYKGCISIRYYDYKIALAINTLYNKIPEKLGVW
ncbi:hypothetical protein HGB07_02915 [Candidatus Roizmanbacteria bacterium]|nr:hypothetical protein [Candidatus Roizmanbacteria bacterium]